MKIIDTHQHLWDLNRFDFSWCARAPQLNRSYLIEDYLAATQGAELVKSVHVEADVDEPFMLAETQYILQLAELNGNPLKGVVAVARPEKSGFREYVERLAGHPNLKGIRRIFHTQPDELINRPLLVENIRALADYNLSFDLCVLARQLPRAIKLIENCPRVSFILDHCGNPPIKEGALQDWREHMQTIADLPNVVCKISGIVTNADHEKWTLDDLRPVVEHMIETFGWNRVMFGSDWPVCTLAASFQQWLDALVYLTRHASNEEHQKLFHDNALRVYQL